MRDGARLTIRTSGARLRRLRRVERRPPHRASYMVHGAHCAVIPCATSVRYRYPRCSTSARCSTRTSAEGVHMQRRRRGDILVFGHLRLGLAAVATILVVGTVGFMLIERFSPLDALYRTVGLMTTSGGFEDEKTTVGKELAVVVVVVGIGSLFYTLGAVAEYLIEGHFGRAIARHRMDQKIERLAGHGIICGFGREGRRTARELAEARQPFGVIDKWPANPVELEAAGLSTRHPS